MRGSNEQDIPHAENTFVDWDAQANKILHVLTKLPEKPETPGFDAHAKLEMEDAIAKLLRSPNNPHGFDGYVVHWRDNPNGRAWMIPK
jgi:hypothetical protein